MYQPECYEQRGRCASFMTPKQWRKERKKEIEMLGEKYSASVSSKADEADEGVYEFGEGDPEEIRG
jgi:hypothetical protein